MSACFFRLYHSDVGKWKNITVQVKCDDRDQPAQEATFTFSVRDTNSFWLNYNLPPVVVGHQFFFHFNKATGSQRGIPPSEPPITL